LANGENEIVFSNISDLPVGVGGKGGIDTIAFLASSSALSDVFHSVSTWTIKPLGAISILKRTCPWSLRQPLDHACRKVP